METEGDKNRGFTHFDSQGNAVMVDVSAKEPSARTAVAKGCIAVNRQTLRAIREGRAKKGDVLGVARIAGILAAKRTAELIPLCHPLIFDTCTIDFHLPEVPASADHPDPLDQAGARPIEAACRVQLTGKTGAEMEALTGVSIALLTIYDMCKAMDRGMKIGNIRLCEKSGGKSGRFIRPGGEGGLNAETEGGPDRTGYA
ncbi:MAG: cyclic pyranopterin monophosphate synthase MoaC [Treponema sp.]|jgi:cyclic pyranopterin phosphate synthase|nr:cyclic pyranopterin monophosphate synthase MoaC [Treponema sp.]